MIAQSRMIGMIAGVLLFYLNACFGTDRSDAESDDCSVCGNGPADFPPISAVKGGKPIPSTESFPWLVAIGLHNNPGQCAGAILDEDFILTAAHCVGNPLGRVNKEKKVYFQTESTERLSEVAFIEDIVLHPRYDYDTSNITGYRVPKYDIALIKLKGKIKCNNSRRSICLPKTDYRPTDEIFYFAGWRGPDTHYLKFTSMDARIGVLQYGILQNLPFEMCLKNIPDIGYLKDHMLCLGNTSQTVRKGDSGGPLMDKINGKYTVVGLSAAVTSRESKVEDPVLYTNVAVFVDWIEKEKEKFMKPSSLLPYKWKCRGKKVPCKDLKKVIRVKFKIKE